MAKLENKEILQAVVMADNFNDHFKPFSSLNSPVIKLNSSKYLLPTQCDSLNFLLFSPYCLLSMFHSSVML